MDADIVQIAAHCSSGQFSRYIKPRRRMSAGAAAVTGLTTEYGLLLLNGTPVETVPLKTAMKDFLDFLTNIENPLLVAHNCFRFDARLLFRCMQKLDFVSTFSSCVIGFSDSLFACKELYPGRKSYKQSDLVAEIVGEIMLLITQ